MADDEEDESSRELSSSGCPWPTYIAIDMIELVRIDLDFLLQNPFDLLHFEWFYDLNHIFFYLLQFILEYRLNRFDLTMN